MAAPENGAHTTSCRDWGDTTGGLRCVLPPRADCCTPKFAFLEDACPVESGQSTADRAVWGEGLGGTWLAWVPGAWLASSHVAWPHVSACRSVYLPLLLWTLTSQSPGVDLPHVWAKRQQHHRATPACQQRKTKGLGLGGRCPRPRAKRKMGTRSFQSGGMRLERLLTL